jgi:hypothetical protein
VARPNYEKGKGSYWTFSESIIRDEKTPVYEPQSFVNETPQNHEYTESPLGNFDLPNSSFDMSNSLDMPSYPMHFHHPSPAPHLQYYSNIHSEIEFDFLTEDFWNPAQPPTPHRHQQHFMQEHQHLNGDLMVDQPGYDVFRVIDWSQQGM